MPKQNIAELAKANGVKPATAYQRIRKGMSVEDATSKPARPFHKTKPHRRKKPAKKAELVWAYVLDNKLATSQEVAKATGVSDAYAYKLMRKIGTPREVFEKEAALPLVAQKEDRLLDDDDDTYRWLQLTFLIAIAAVITAWVFSVTAK
jgi:transposase-like protein